MRRTPFLTLALSLALVAAACGDDDDTETSEQPVTETTLGTETSLAPTDDPTTTVAPGGDSETTTTTVLPTDLPLTDSFRGVTAETIKIGVAMLDFQQLYDNGFIDRPFGDLELAYQAAIDEVNDNGGVLGRQIEAVYDLYFPVGDTEGLDTCIQFTEDEEVFAVLGVIPGFLTTIIDCITRDHETVHIGFELNQASIEAAGGLLVTPGITADRRLDGLLALLEQTGDLDGSTVAVFGSQSEQDRIENAVVPALEAAGIEVAEVGLVDTSSADPTQIDAAAAVVAERFRSAGVDTIVLAGLTAPSRIPLFYQAFGGEVQFYSDAAEALLDQAQTAEDQAPFEGAISLVGLGEDDGEQFTEENMQTCIANWEERHPDIPVVDPAQLAEGEPNVFGAIRDACNQIATLVAGAAAAGPDLTNDSWIEGIQSVGEIDLYAIPFASFGPDKFDAEDGFRLVQFSSAVGDNGGFESLTELLDSTP